MADQADVYVKNRFTGDVRVIRYLSSGVSDLEITISPGNEEKVLLTGTDVYLVIKPPAGKDLKLCFITVRSDVDLSVPGSRTDSLWKVQILPNSLPPEVPTTVNIEAGDQP